MSDGAGPDVPESDARTLNPAEVALRAARPRLSAQVDPVKAAGAGLALVWLLLTLAVALFGGVDTAVFRFLAAMVVIFLPAVVLWLVAARGRQLEELHDELARITATLDPLRTGWRAPQPLAPGPATLEKKLDEIARAQKKTDAALAMLAAGRGSGAGGTTKRAAAVSPPEQPSLGLETPQPPAEPLPRDVLIAALNFPEGPDDAAGFKALRRALGDHGTAQVIQSSQDVLTLLSQDGIYTDDLQPDRARSELWRRFARGERGRAVAGLGGIHDRELVARCAGRMRSDTVFRDAAHHFLRKFDQFLSGFEPLASDAEIAALADTRTARAFMLLGRVAGTFD